MAKLTDKDLYEFVYRADTAEKISTAEKWLRAHDYLTSRHTLDDLIFILNRTAKRLFRTQMVEYEEALYRAEAFAYVPDIEGQFYITDRATGEVVNIA